LGAALEARKISAGEGRLTAEAVGEIEEEDGVLVVRRIHVVYHLRVASDSREAAIRAHQKHVGYCPMAQTIRNCVEVTTSLETESLSAE
jgi:organic hydroperoxide reductase OsmC/OhrA